MTCDRLTIVIWLLAATLVQAAVTEYEITFEATWSRDTHPLDFPTSAHFSALIGGTHGQDVRFWELDGIATQGIENMAESGTTARLQQEVEGAIEQGTALSVIKDGSIGRSPGQVSTNFNIDSAYPLVTLVSMVAPSPDWFVAVSALPLRRNDRWRHEVVVPLSVYDSGTDSGQTFLAANANIANHIPISLLNTYAFANGEPVGTFTFQHIPEPTTFGAVLVGIAAISICRIIGIEHAADDVASTR